ncbi:MAG: flavodoxin domain-containing protein [Campylobacter sp.]|nr:flavodoxin domain-containing protein [Campylobacter sp.]
MAKNLLVYATKGGNSKIVGEYIAQKLGFEIKEAKDLDENDLKSYDGFIFLASTHGDGQIQNKFDNKLELLNKTDFENRPVALVGVGNIARHSFDFCSGISAFLPVLKKAKLVGASNMDGYEITNSRAFVNGKFIGLVLNYPDDKKWQDRVDIWINEIKKYFN